MSLIHEENGRPISFLTVKTNIMGTIQTRPTTLAESFDKEIKIHLHYKRQKNVSKN